jgi:hypothetical protein
MSAPRLAVMTFPQRWDGAGRLTLNALLIPSGDPLDVPLVGADPAVPAFADGAPALRVLIDPGLEALPDPAAASTLVPTVLSEPAAPRATFELLVAQLTAAGLAIAKLPPAATRPRAASIRKALPGSYQAAGGGRPNGTTTTTDEDFACALRCDAPPVPARAVPRTDISWGEVISYGLRQPRLATLLGLRYELAVDLDAAQAAALATGAFAWVALDGADPWVVADVPGPAPPPEIALHAARLPALAAAARPVFAAVQFPLAATIDPVAHGVQAAQAYADGFAKLVHTTQPATAEATLDDGALAPATDLGIQVGWDDEQIVRWHNDQLELMDAQRAGGLGASGLTPLGVAGYRVDVEDVTPGVAPTGWQSLVAAESELPAGLGTWTGELTVEPTPARPDGSGAAEAWLPRYFATWRGGSLCDRDPVPQALARTGSAQPSATTGVPPAALLAYGHAYRLRVRLADLTGGGPAVSGDDPIDPAPAAVAVQPFHRLVAPKAPGVSPSGPAGMPDAVTVRRPPMGYPEVLFTALGGADQPSRDAVRDAFAQQAADRAALPPGAPPREPAGLPDPDVTRVEVNVAIRHPLHDPAAGGAPFAPLYTVERELAALDGAGAGTTDPGTDLALAYVEAPDVTGWTAPGPGEPIAIPRGRDVQLTIRSKVRDAEPGYFAPGPPPTGLAAALALRCEIAAEPPLLQLADAAPPVRGLLFRRPPGVDAPPLVAQLAQELGVAAAGDALTSPPGRRVVFGACAALRHALSADGETLTLSAPSQLLRNWIVVVVLDLERDWTWDGLEDAGLTVERAPADDPGAAVAIGQVVVPRTLGPGSARKPDRVWRTRTRLVFLDVIDPHEQVRDDVPQALAHRYRVVAHRLPPGPAGPPAPPGPGAPGVEQDGAGHELRLPIALPPDQVPDIASVGTASAPYVAGPGYASTEPRERMLFLELTEPLRVPEGRALFARVLATAPDPLLYDPAPDAPDPFTPPLPLDPELVRVVVPGETDDRAGMAAMVRLTGTSVSDRHFLLPLPSGVAADDPALFGFWSYELRVGHAGEPGDERWWSTANARFGAPRRVVGVQHPAPALACHVARYRRDHLLIHIGGVVRDRFPPQRAPFAGAAVVEALPPWLLRHHDDLVLATATFATPVRDGVPLRPLGSEPHTSLWFLLYGQVVQADGASMRNVLLATVRGVHVGEQTPLEHPLDDLLGGLRDPLRRDRAGYAAFLQADIATWLKDVALGPETPLSVLAVELLPRGTGVRLRGGAFDHRGDFRQEAEHGIEGMPMGRIMRVSPLTAVEALC